MMAKTKQQIGKASRNKGKNFERQCRGIMHQLTGWPYWKRTQRGDKQWAGDLASCDEVGKLVSVVPPGGHTYYVECRARATLRTTELIQWWFDVGIMARDAVALRWVLLAKQDRGPVLAICSWEQRVGAELVARLF